MAALELLRDSLCKSIPGELTRMWVNATDERKWHRGAVQALMKASLFAMPDVDTCLAKVFALTLSHPAQADVHLQTERPCISLHALSAPSCWVHRQGTATSEQAGSRGML